MSRRSLLLLALALTLVLSVLPRMVDRYEERIDRGPGSAALRDPFLAAERFLASTGVHARGVRRWQQLEQLDNSIGTLILSDSRLVLSEPQLERVLGWVEAGGNLIVGAPPPSDDAQDPLFARFGLSSHAVEPKDKKPAQKMREMLREMEAQKGGAARAVPPEELTELQFEGRDKPVRAWFGVPRFLHHPALDHDEDTDEEDAAEDEQADTAQPQDGGDAAESAGAAPEDAADDAGNEEQGASPSDDAAAGDDEQSASVTDDGATHAELVAVASNAHGPQLLRFSYGRGRITVLVDTDLWDFQRIDRYDHAWLLYRLVDPERFGDEVRLLYERGMPSLASLARRHAQQPLIAAALLLLAWLWHRGRRFGAAREPIALERRALADHLRASAEYLWRNGLHLHLLDAMREAVRARAPHASETALPALLAQRSGMPLEAVKEALRERPQTLDEQRFTDLSRRLQQLRNST